METMQSAHLKKVAQSNQEMATINLKEAPAEIHYWAEAAQIHICLAMETVMM